MTAVRIVRSLGGVATTLAAAQCAPAASWLPPLRRLFPGLSGVGAEDHVALTFDDGPDPESTPRFLEELAAADAHATFFMLGERLERFPECGRSVVAAGHEIAVHGWRHGYAFGTPPWSTALRRARAVVEDVCGVTPLWYRPPYGVLTAGAAVAARHAGLRPVLWSTWGRDWTATATPESVLATLAPGLRGGATVLLHDSDCTSAPGAWRSALGALPALLEQCERAGCRVGPLRDHGL